MHRSVISSVLVLASLSCAPSHEIAARSSEPSAAGALAPIEVRALEGEVAEVRHLQLVHPLDVRALSDEDFRGRVASQARLGRTASGGRTAFWQTVGVGALDRSPGETERRVLEEEVVGFYDPRAKSLFVRASSGDQGQIVPRHPGTQSVLVHEIVHALQDQHFDLKYAQSLDEDEGLAYQALAEGDAILTSNGVGALEKGVFAQWRSRISDRTRALSCTRN